MEYLIEYGMFLAKAGTIVVSVIIVLSVIAVTGQKNKKPGKKGSIKATRLNDHIEEMRDTLREKVLDKDYLKLVYKKERKKSKAERKEKKQQLKKEQAEEFDSEETRKKRFYVLNFKGNIGAEAISSLREEITAVLSVADPKDEVLVRLESPGGLVNAYGLASSQL